MTSQLAPKPDQPVDLPIRGKLRTAIELMVHEGLKRAEAAERAGMTDNGLYAALRRPHVLRFKTSLFAAMVNAEAERSVVTMVGLRDKAASEHVKLEAAKHLAALGGVRPPEVKRNERPEAQPGYVIDLSEREVIEPDGTRIRERRILTHASDKRDDEQDEPQALDVDFTDA